MFVKKIKLHFKKLLWYKTDKMLFDVLSLENKQLGGGNSKSALYHHPNPNHPKPPYH